MKECFSRELSLDSSVAWKILFIFPTIFLPLLILNSVLSSTASYHSLAGLASVSVDLTSSLLILFASRMAVTFCTKVWSDIFWSNVACHSVGICIPCGLYSVISGHLKSMCGSAQPQHISAFFFWPRCQPSL